MVVLRRGIVDRPAFATTFATCLTDHKQVAVLAEIAAGFGVTVTAEALKDDVFTPLKLVELTAEVWDTLRAIVSGTWAGSVVFTSQPGRAGAPPAPAAQAQATATAPSAGVPMFRDNAARTGEMPGHGPNPAGVLGLRSRFATCGSIRSFPPNDGTQYALAASG